MPVSPQAHKPNRPSVPKHKPRRDDGTDRQKRRLFNTGSKTWRRMRLVILARDAYTCQSCSKYGNHVDHIDGDSHNNDTGNLQTLCHSCHSIKTAREQNAK